MFGSVNSTGDPNFLPSLLKGMNRALFPLNRIPTIPFPRSATWWIVRISYDARLKLVKGVVKLTRRAFVLSILKKGFEEDERSKSSFMYTDILSSGPIVYDERADALGLTVERTGNETIKKMRHNEVTDTMIFIIN